MSSDRKTQPADAQPKRLIDPTPRRGAAGFRCPHCNVFAGQNWLPLGYNKGESFWSAISCRIGPPCFAICEACEEMTLWLGGQMVWPLTSTAPMPSPDTPDDVKADYMEARSVFERSPRAAGGLLRIAFEKLFPHLGVTKGSPNEAIAELVKKGLALGPLQQALDSMRIFANQSAHNGFVKLEDQPETVSFLFVLLNYIVEQMITRPKEIAAMYKLIPQDKLDGIAKRDGKQ